MAAANTASAAAASAASSILRERQLKPAARDADEARIEDLERERPKRRRMAEAARSAEAAGPTVCHVAGAAATAVAVARPSPGKPALHADPGGGRERSSPQSHEGCGHLVLSPSVEQHGGKRLHAPATPGDAESQGKARKKGGYEREENGADVPLPTITRSQKAEGVPWAGGRADEFAKGRVTDWGGSGTNFDGECKLIDRACIATQCQSGAASSGDCIVRCPTCEGYHKPVRFRRVPEGALWRGCQPGTLVCNRCHMQLRWGRP